MQIAPGERHELCRGLHAEQNAIIQSAFHGVSISGADLYCTHLPCSICIKMLINAGIKKVFYLDGYPDDLSMKLIDESSIVLQKVILDKNENNVAAATLKKAKSKGPTVAGKRRARKGV
jgi:dCMP deaminase